MSAMSRTRSRRARIGAAATAITLAALALAVAACDEDAPVSPTAAHAAVAAPDASHGAGHGSANARGASKRIRIDAKLERQLNQVRRATKRYSSIDKAIADKWSSRLTDCMSDPILGGMGVHYGDLTRFDDVVEMEKPEILVYQPKGKKLKLVAVEYAVPFDKWTKPEPPSVMGQAFHRNEAFGLWVLHAWVHRKNPSGIFNDWNPKVPAC